MEKVCTNKNHSYKHNEQINKQNIDNLSKTNEGCVIDLNSKINRIFLSSCMNKSKDL
jgi:hypothetical protein